MEEGYIHINIGVCSSWGRKYPKHMFRTQYATKNGHRHCINCGMTKDEVEDRVNDIERRIVDLHTLQDGREITFLTEEDIEKGRHYVFI